MNADLQQLKDIHLPPPINTWPIAPGWIGLLVLVFALLSYLLYLWHKANKRKYTVKFALAKLEKLQHSMTENPKNINIAAEISILLRRTALHYFRREEIAGLSGKHWLHFLNRSGDTTKFTEETGTLLTDAPYRKDSTPDLTPLFTLARAWLINISKKKMVSVEK